MNTEIIHLKIYTSIFKYKQIAYVDVVIAKFIAV